MYIETGGARYPCTGYRPGTDEVWKGNALEWHLSSISNQSLAERAQLNNQGAVCRWFAFG